MTGKLRLKIAIGEYPHTSAIRNGSISIDGVNAQIVTVEPQIAAFRRMVRDVEFDVCELAPTTYIIARCYGAPFVALPIFVMRRFHHAGLLVRPDAGICLPKDLEGRRVGVRAYSVTTGVWTRAVLMDEYALDASRVTWVVDDEEHVPQLRLPPNVVHAPAGKSLAEMMTTGELDAGFHGNAGIGRAGSPTTGWRVVQADYPELFTNAAALEKNWYHRTGIYPMHGTVVVKDSILAQHPWLAGSLFQAFSRAKSEWLARLEAGLETTASDRKYAALRDIVGSDPLPYGLAANLRTITTLEKTAFEQRLIPRRIPAKDLFIDPEKL